MRNPFSRQSAADRERAEQDRRDREAAARQAEREAREARFAGFSRGPAPSPGASRSHDRGVTSTGPEDITISGQALGEGCTVSNGGSGSVSFNEPVKFGGPRARTPGFDMRGANVNNGIQNTGSGKVTIHNSAMGAGMDATYIDDATYGDPQPGSQAAPEADLGHPAVADPAPAADLEAGS